MAAKSPLSPLQTLTLALLLPSLSACVMYRGPNYRSPPTSYAGVVEVIYTPASFETATLAERWSLDLSAYHNMRGNKPEEQPYRQSFRLEKEHSQSLENAVLDEAADGFTRTPMDYQYVRGSSYSGLWRFDPKECTLKLYNDNGYWLASLKSTGTEDYRSQQPDNQITVKPRRVFRLASMASDPRKLGVLAGKVFYVKDWQVYCPEPEAELPAGSEPGTQ